ncbi:AAA family ATPase [Streptomyces sp. NPDC047974]|uniref:AAA family ATPase n=1 Tax=Streptomyces sp. NPDC047974 TaxID=3154343 RepID=UPI0033D9D80A
MASRERASAEGAAAYASREEAGGGAPLVETFRSLLFDATQMRRIPRSQALVEGLLATDSLAWFWGPPGQGKSFLAQDISAHVGAGLEWQGRPVKQGPVIYVVAEGGGGYPDRIEAWEEYHDRPMEDVLFFHHPLQFLNDAQVAAFLMLVAEVRPALVVVDTQSRCMVGHDENLSVPMTKLIAALDLIRTAAGGACVLTLHHGDRAGRNPRGFSAIDGAADTLIKVTRSGKGPVKLEVTKQKDAEQGEPMKLPLDKAGRSLVVTRGAMANCNSGCNSGDAPQTWETLGLTSLQRDIYVTLREDGKRRIAELAQTFGKARQNINSAVNVLVKAGLVVRESPWVMATSEPSVGPEEAGL